MKQCTYCGKENPDEVLVCATDQQPLRQAVSTSPTSSPLPVKSRKKSDFVSLESMLIWAIVIVVIWIIVAFFMVLFEAGRMHDSL
jgi:uncharacterized membrane protein YvbJ